MVWTGQTNNLAGIVAKAGVRPQLISDRLQMFWDNLRTDGTKALARLGVEV